ncbi:Methionyl-tRNA formyltransferase [[Mycoplasma] cavipharyngis]|uniref:methionyl-tRNA formyltransferase n=1 Tax=[Mycoplasma] cavipharyngis TaxID=92757 RepID=UPI0037049D31
MKKIIFLGTPEFGANALEALIDLKYKPILVICQPDRHFDRKKKIILSPVKKLALMHHIPILQPEKINQVYQTIIDLQPDLMITAAYGQFIPEKILKICPLGAWNIHGSLLPKLRGGAPIQWAIINDYQTTGVCLMKMVKKMDAGNIIASEVVNIDPNETYQSLLLKCNIATKQLLQKHFEKIIIENYYEIVQDENDVSFAYNIQIEQTYIDWNQPAKKIDCLVRGLYNKPLAKTIYQNISIKVHQVAISINQKPVNQVPGTILAIDQNGIAVSTGDQNVILLKKIQLPNKNPVAIKDLINGKTIFKNNTKFSNYESKINL